MEREKNTLSSSPSDKTKSSVRVLHVLVVDDDTTCLAVVAAVLRTWKYEVVTVKHPVDALSTLRVKRGLFDLVVTDIHMPDMNGFELQKQVEEEFKLPVVMMSADDKENVILKGLAGGAAFFIVKPINLDELKNIWQYAVSIKKGKSMGAEQTGSDQEESLTGKASNNGDANSASSVNEEKRHKRESKRKVRGRDSTSGEEDRSDSMPKKTKVVWTNALHNRFLEAVRKIGVDRAVPKKILELMNIPGLTRENIASHLQKYRMFLRRVSDASISIEHGFVETLPSKTVRSSSTPGHPLVMLNDIQQQYPQFQEQQKIRTSFQPRFGASTLGSSRFFDQEASSNPLHQANSLSFQIEPDFINQTGLSSFGDASSSLTQHSNSTSLHQQQTRARLEYFTGGLTNFSFSTFGLRGPNFVQGIKNTRSFNNLNPIPNFNFLNNNYAGIQMTSSGELVRPSSTRLVGGSEALNGFSGSYGLMNLIHSGNVTIARTENENCGFDSETQIPPRSRNDIIQQEINALVLPLAPQLQQQQQQQSILDNQGGENNHMFDLMHNTSNVNNTSPCQAFGAEGTLDDIISKQINNLSPNEQGCTEFGTGSYKLDDYFLWLDDQHMNLGGDGELMGIVSDPGARSRDNNLADN